jgi:hypothetical protein
VNTMCSPSVDDCRSNPAPRPFALALMARTVKC